MNFHLYFLFVIWAFMAVRKNRRIFQTNYISTYLGLLIFVALLSAFHKIYSGAISEQGLYGELLDIKNWANPFIIFFIFFNVIEDDTQSRQGITALTGLLVVTLLPMISHTLGLIEWDIIRDVQPGRSAGFAEANQYATFIVLLAPLPLSYLLFRKERMVKVSALVSISLILLGLLLTGSRGGTLSFLVAIGAYATLIYRERMISFTPIAYAGLMFLLLLTLLYFLVPDYSRKVMAQRFNPYAFQNIDDFSNGRLVLLRKGLTVFLESPLIGHGHGTFMPLMKKRFSIPYNSHNDYLLYLVHYGAIGFTILLMLLTKLYSHIYHSFKSTQHVWDKAIYASYLGGFIGYSVSMAFVNILGAPAFIFWLYTALVYRISLTRDDIIPIVTTPLNYLYHSRIPLNVQADQISTSTITIK